MIEKAKVGGSLLFLGAIQGILIIAIMEAMIPGYSVSANFISDLGTYAATAHIFTLTLVVQGLLTIVGVILAKEEIGKQLTTLLVISGICQCGVGIFPDNFYPILSGQMFMATGLFHMAFAAPSIILSIVVMILAWRLFNPPFSYISAGMGIFTACAMVVMVAGLGGLGRGGTERLVIYPLMFWNAALGAALVGVQAQVKQSWFGGEE